MILKTKVVINSTTIKDDSLGVSDPKLIFSWAYERTAENGISELIIECPKSINDSVSLSVGQVVEIWKGYTTSTDEKIFSGYISEFEPSAGKITIICKDKLWDLIRKNVNKVYLDTDVQAGQISEIAEDLIQTYGGLTASVVATGTGDGETIGEFRCIHTDIYERLMALAKAVDYQIRYDAANDLVHFEPRGYNQSGITLTVGQEIISVPKWTYDTSEMVNDLRIDGAVAETQLRYPTTGSGQIGVTTNFATDAITLPKTPEVVELFLDSNSTPTTIREGGSKEGSTSSYYYIDRENKQIKPSDSTSAFPTNEYAIINYTWLAPSPIHMINQDSIDNYGSFEKQITLTDVITISDAEARATEILNRFSQPFTIGEMFVKSDSSLDIKVGDTVVIVDNVNSPAINEEFVITKQIIKYPSSNQEIVVGDRLLVLAGWQMDIEDRLKRLEEQNIKNQDLIMELINTNLSVTPTPRYRKILTTDISGEYLYWNNTSYGTWNSFKWGNSSNKASSVNHFIMQYQNIYTEDFIDEDFKDTTNSTATWGSSGSVSFTSGQIAQSEPIDLENGTITTAKLTATETSGDFLYFMNADGNNLTRFNTGTISGATYTTGIVGDYCLSFNGSGNYATTPTLSDFNTNADFSISVWVSIDSDSGAYRILHHRDGTGTGRILLNVTDGALNNFLGGANRVSNSTLSTGTNYHIVITYDASAEEQKWYVNNILTNTNTGVTAENNVGVISIGISKDLTSTPFDGLIDEIRIYNKVLSTDEINTLYSKADSGDGLILRYSMEEGSGTSLYDTSSWEMVDNGVLYTFEKSGTELRYKILESGGSTGEISKVVITNYH